MKNITTKIGSKTGVKAQLNQRLAVTIARAQDVCPAWPERHEVLRQAPALGDDRLAAAAGDRRRYLIAAERGAPDPTPIVQALRAVHRGLATRRIKDVHEVYPPLVFAALVLLLVEAAIGTRRRLRFPEQAP